LAYNTREDTIKPNESLVLDYFKRVKSGDMAALLDMFSRDSVIYEPLSKSRCLTGTSEIESFLRTVIFANTAMQQEIKIQGREQNAKVNENRVVVLVTFHKGWYLTCRFTFEFETQCEWNRRKIKTLNLEFIE
jgi:ketosteroid isomerase-like protein